MVESRVKIIGNWQYNNQGNMKGNYLTGLVINCAIEVHKNLGPGLLESDYHKCLEYEFIQNKIKFQSQLEIPVVYKGVALNNGYRIDFKINNELILELKRTDSILPVHEAQVLTYMKLTGAKVGLLINFNVYMLRHGIKRYVL